MRARARRFHASLATAGDRAVYRTAPTRRGRRSTIQSPDDIWQEIVRVTELPGTTSAPRLQPIAARIVMLQSGMRAPMGIKVKGPDLETIEAVALELEALLDDVGTDVAPGAVGGDSGVVSGIVFGGISETETETAGGLGDTSDKAGQQTDDTDA